MSGSAEDEGPMSGGMRSFRVDGWAGHFSKASGALQLFCFVLGLKELELYSGGRCWPPATRPRKS